MIDLVNQKNAYKRHFKLSSVINKRVTIVGLGGLGSHLADSLIRMGFINLKLIDGDIVEPTNLSRQINYNQDDIGIKKVDATRSALVKINPAANILTVDTFLDGHNTNYLNGSDIILDGTDNYQARKLINSFCFKNNVPWIYASAIGLNYSYAAFVPGDGPCFECVTEDDAESLTCNSKFGISITSLKEVTSKQINLMFKVLSGTTVHKSIFTESSFVDVKSEFDFSFLYNENCSACSNEVKHNNSQSIRVICDGHAKDVRSSFLDPASIEENIGRDFSITNMNDLFTEYKYNDKRIVVYPNKVSFYGFDKKEILRLCS